MPAIVEIGRCFEIGGLNTCSVMSCKLSTGKVVPNRRVILDYVCAECLHGLVEYVNDVRCPECGSHNIIHRKQIREQELDGMEVMDALPAEFRALVTNDTPVTNEHLGDALWSTGRCIYDDPQPRNERVEEFMRAKNLFKKEN